MVFVDVEDIVWIKVSCNIVLIYLVDCVYELCEMMVMLVEWFDLWCFVWVYCLVIINVCCVEVVYLWFNGYYVVIMDIG